MKLKEIAEKYAEYEIDESKLIELLTPPTPKSVWKLKDGYVYYGIDYAYDEIFSMRYGDNTEFDTNVRNNGNMFLTKEEAEFELERIKVEAELLKLGGTRNMMSGGRYEDKHYFYYDYEYGNIHLSFNKYTCRTGTIHFPTKEACKKAIETIGEERIKKYLFYVED